MKSYIMIFVTCIFSFCISKAQNDTMYVMKNGWILWEYKVSEVDSIIFYKPTNPVLIDTRDGNHYNLVKIGNQIWMAENFKYLPVVHSITEFKTRGENSQPAYGVYGYDGNDLATAKSQANYTTYGVLYNWYAVNTANFCPTGWHVPGELDWTILTDYLGGYEVAGGKLKETGTVHWASPNTGATNETGFTALPGGYFSYVSGFLSIGSNGYWWSANDHPSGGTWLSAFWRGISSGYSTLSSGYWTKRNGLSVRCIKD